ncbi:MAG: hypothetical protein WD471_00305 [Candidatus Paceibacterota bacterium]
MKLNKHLAVFVAILMVFGFSFSFAVAQSSESLTQSSKSVAQCGNNFITITRESPKIYQCSIAETVACKVANSVASEEAERFSCPSRCPEKGEISVTQENLSCSGEVDPTIGLLDNKASCRVSASFSCSSQTDSFSTATTSLEEIMVVSDDVINIQDLSVDEKTEPELKKIMSSFARFITSWFKS